MRGTAKLNRIRRPVFSGISDKVNSSVKGSPLIPWSSSSFSSPWNSSSSDDRTKTNNNTKTTRQDSANTDVTANSDDGGQGHYGSGTFNHGVSLSGQINLNKYAHNPFLNHLGHVQVQLPGLEFALIKNLQIFFSHNRVDSILQIQNRISKIIASIITQAYRIRNISVDLQIQITLAVERIVSKYRLIEILVHIRKIASELKIAVEQLLANVKADGSLSIQTGSPGLFEILVHTILSQQGNEGKIPELKAFILSTIIEINGPISAKLENKIRIVIENAFKKHLNLSWQDRVIFTVHDISFNVELILVNAGNKFTGLREALKAELIGIKFTQLDALKKRVTQFVINFISQKKNQISANVQNQISVAVESIINEYNFIQIWLHLDEVTMKIEKRVQQILAAAHEIQVNVEIGTSGFLQLLSNKITSIKNKIDSISVLKEYILKIILEARGNLSVQIQQKISSVLDRILKKYKNTYKNHISEILTEVNIACGQIFLHLEIYKDLQVFLQNNLNVQVSFSTLTQQITNLILAKHPGVPKIQILLLQHYILHVLLENNFGVKDPHGINFDLLLQQILGYVEGNLDSSLTWGINKSSSAIGNLQIDFPTIENQLLLVLNHAINSQGILLVKQTTLAKKIADIILNTNTSLYSLINRQTLVAKIKHLILKAKNGHRPINIYDLENNIANYVLETIANIELNGSGKIIPGLLYTNNHVSINSSHKIGIGINSLVEGGQSQWNVNDNDEKEVVHAPKNPLPATQQPDGYEVNEEKEDVTPSENAGTSTKVIDSGRLGEEQTTEKLPSAEGTPKPFTVSKEPPKIQQPSTPQSGGYEGEGNITPSENDDTSSKKASESGTLGEQQTTEQLPSAEGTPKPFTVSEEPNKIQEPSTPQSGGYEVGNNITPSENDDTSSKKASESGTLGEEQTTEKLPSAEGTPKPFTVSEEPTKIQEPSTPQSGGYEGEGNITPSENDDTSSKKASESGTLGEEQTTENLPSAEGTPKPSTVSKEPTKIQEPSTPQSGGYEVGNNITPSENDDTSSKKASDSGRLGEEQTTERLPSAEGTPGLTTSEESSSTTSKLNKTVSLQVLSEVKNGVIINWSLLESNITSILSSQLNSGISNESSLGHQIAELILKIIPSLYMKISSAELKIIITDIITKARAEGAPINFSTLSSQITNAIRIRSEVKEASGPSQNSTFRVKNKESSGGINYKILQNKISNSINYLVESKGSSQVDGDSLSKSLTATLIKQFPLIKEHLSYSILEKRVSQIIAHLKAQGYADLTSEDFKQLIYYQVLQIVKNFVRTLTYKVLITFRSQLPEDVQKECVREVGQVVINQIFVMGSERINSDLLNQQILRALAKFNVEAQVKVTDMSVPSIPKLVSEVATAGFNVPVVVPRYETLINLTFLDSAKADSKHLQEKIFSIIHNEISTSGSNWDTQGLQRKILKAISGFKINISIKVVDTSTAEHRVVFKFQSKAPFSPPKVEKFNISWNVSVSNIAAGSAFEMNNLQQAIHSVLNKEIQSHGTNLDLASLRKQILDIISSIKADINVKVFDSSKPNPLILSVQHEGSGKADLNNQKGINILSVNNCLEYYF